MLETVVSEKSVAHRQTQQPAQPASAPQQPAVQSALNAGRFRGMLQRAGTLNGRHATAPPTSSTPPPALAPNVEKALPPAVAASASPEPDSRVGTPPVDPMADNAPAAPTPPPIVITEKPLVAEPDETNGDAAPESLPPAAEDAPPEIPPKEDTPAPDGDGGQPQADGELADEEAAAPAEEAHPLA